MSKSIFSQIVDGELPCHKVYEDDKTLAFLNINPSIEGHTLVIPKTEVDHLDDLQEDDYFAVMATVKKVMQRIKEVMGSERACLKVEGFEVPHAHVHVLPCNDIGDFVALPSDSPVNHEQLAEIAKKLQF